MQFLTAPPQTEKAFQKQLGVNGGWKKPARKTPGKGGARFYKNVRLGFKTPKEAIEGEPRAIPPSPGLALCLFCFSGRSGCSSGCGGSTRRSCGVRSEAIQAWP